MALATQLLCSMLGRAFERALAPGGRRRRRLLLGTAPGCWSVRRREDAGKAWGTGDWVCEDAWPPPDPLPLTTIAWWLAHLAAWTDVYRSWTFEDQRLDLRDVDVLGAVPKCPCPQRSEAGVTVDPATGGASTRARNRALSIGRRAGTR